MYQSNSASYTDPTTHPFWPSGPEDPGMSEQQACPPNDLEIAKLAKELFEHTRKGSPPPQQSPPPQESERAFLDLYLLQILPDLPSDPFAQPSLPPADFQKQAFQASSLTIFDSPPSGADALSTSPLQAPTGIASNGAPFSYLHQNHGSFLEPPVANKNPLESADTQPTRTIGRQRDRGATRKNPYDRNPSTQKRQPSPNDLDDSILPAPMKNRDRRSQLFQKDTAHWRFRNSGLAECLRCDGTSLVLATPHAIAAHDRNFHAENRPFICGIGDCPYRFQNLNARTIHIKWEHSQEKCCPCCHKELVIKPQIPTERNFDKALEWHFYHQHLKIHWKCLCDQQIDDLTYLRTHSHKKYPRITKDRQENFIDPNTGLPLNAHYVDVAGQRTIVAYPKNRQPPIPHPVTWSTI